MNPGIFEPQDYESYRQDYFQSRWLRPSQWEDFITKIKLRETSFESKIIGQSVEGRNITCWRWGTGKKSVLLWSQMHGNEPTGTMALADLMAFLCSEEDGYRKIREELRRSLTVYIIPILNPDGAEAFTRYNAQGADINRDARRRITPEMRTLISLIEEINPSFTFNLHDQRNIFSAGPHPKPATISFLAASADESKKLTPAREKAMSLITNMHKCLAQHIPGCIGRYTDEYYPRAIGDYLHAQGIPCILIESGAAFDDPLRLTARKMNFLALLEAFRAILINKPMPQDIEHYQSIPENRSLFYDLIFRNSLINNSGLGNLDLSLLAEEQPNPASKKLRKRYLVKEIGDLSYHFGLGEYSDIQILCKERIEPERPAQFSVYKDGRLLYAFNDGYVDEKY